MTPKEYNAALFKEWNTVIPDGKTLMLAVFMDANLKPSIAAVPLFKDTALLKSMLLDLIVNIDSAKKIEYNGQ